VDLTAQQLALLRSAPFDGFRPGSNIWSDCYVADGKPEHDHICDGEEIDALVRHGLLIVEELEEPRPMGEEHPDGFVPDITHRYSLSEAAMKLIGEAAGAA